MATATTVVLFLANSHLEMEKFLKSQLTKWCVWLGVVFPDTLSCANFGINITQQLKYNLSNTWELHEDNYNYFLYNVFYFLDKKDILENKILLELETLAN